jgi:hypothetical protein
MMGDGGRGADGTNHMLVVTGVDRAQGLVYLNDPGTDEGGQWAVPLTIFQDAWADGNNEMLVTDQPPPEGATPTQPPRSPSAEPQPPTSVPQPPAQPLPGPDRSPVDVLPPGSPGAVILSIDIPGEEIRSLDTGEPFSDGVEGPSAAFTDAVDLRSADSALTASEPPATPGPIALPGDIAAEPSTEADDESSSDDGLLDNVIDAGQEVTDGVRRALSAVFSFLARALTL